MKNYLINPSLGYPNEAWICQAKAIRSDIQHGLVGFVKESASAPVASIALSQWKFLHSVKYLICCVEWWAPKDLSAKIINWTGGRVCIFEPRDAEPSAIWPGWPCGLCMHRAFKSFLDLGGALLLWTPTITKKWNEFHIFIFVYIYKYICIYKPGTLAKSCNKV